MYFFLENISVEEIVPCTLKKVKISQAPGEGAEKRRRRPGKRQVLRRADAEPDCRETYTEKYSEEQVGRTTRWPSPGK